jgi:hypothetical protein
MTVSPGLWDPGFEWDAAGEDRSKTPWDVNVYYLSPLLRDALSHCPDAGRLYSLLVGEEE